MGIEIERKFLVKNDNWKNEKQVFKETIIQGYLSTDPIHTVRIRTTESDDKFYKKVKNGFITIKGKTIGISRSEYEYEISFADAQEMLNSMCSTFITKIRNTIEIVHNNQTYNWYIDEFTHTNYGLVIAEIELSNDKEFVILPSWAGLEVSDDHRYFNSNLISKPYTMITDN